MKGCAATSSAHIVRESSNMHLMSLLLLFFPSQFRRDYVLYTIAHLPVMGAVFVTYSMLPYFAFGILDGPFSLDAARFCCCFAKPIKRCRHTA